MPEHALEKIRKARKKKKKMTFEEEREFCDFYIFIGEKNGNKGFVIEASSYEHEMGFRSVQYTDDLQSFKSMPRYER